MKWMGEFHPRYRWACWPPWKCCLSPEYRHAESTQIDSFARQTAMRDLALWDPLQFLKMQYMSINVNSHALRAKGAPLFGVDLALLWNLRVMETNAPLILWGFGLGKSPEPLLRHSVGECA
jgi:hypothetical protein